MNFGLDVATDGEYADPHKLVDLAVVAEQAGWDGFFIWDVLFAHEARDESIADPWITLAAIAVKTQRIRIGAFLTPLARRRPWQVARQTVTLDHLCQGRLIFGAALGYQPLDFVPFGEEYDTRIRAEKLDEGLAILKGLWTEDDFNFQGTHYQLKDVTFKPRSVQLPYIPVWVAGGWPRRKPFRRAAQWDGVYVMTVNQETNELLTPDEVKEIAAYIKSHRRRPEPFDIAINVEIPSDTQQAAEMLQAYAGAGATWCIMLARNTVAEYRELIHRGPPKLSA
jgi:alkanesulfonate monooxygenase SsuD/methylene tetrahydromethanopterin reductase-like flavin-dependent oxidoreductase (luciferase family)